MKIAAVMALCYLMGAVPVALILGKLLKGIDIRTVGSGNVGASNVLRTLGLGPAIVVFILDTAKGAGAVFLTQAILSSHSHLYYLVIAGALLSIIGHNFSCFIGFKGGKGVATSLGIIIGFSPAIAAISFGLWVLLVGVTRYISIASMLASASVPVQMFLSDRLYGFTVPVEYSVCAVVAAAMIQIKHVSNIRRLASGTEPRFGQKVKVEEKEEPK